MLAYACDRSCENAHFDLREIIFLGKMLVGVHAFTLISNIQRG